MTGTQKPCTDKQYTVTDKDLPLSCPTDDMRLWDAHPKVYLPIEEQGHVKCPYCGADYYLQQ